MYIGLAHGRGAKAEIERGLAFYTNLFWEASKLRWPQVQLLAKEFDDVIRAQWPRYYDEIRDRDVLDILALNVRSEIVFGQFSDGCTSAYCAGKGQTYSYMGQNWDWMEEQKANLVQLTIVQTGLPAIKMITEAGIIGKIGLNSAGVGVCFNAIRARGLDKTRLPVHLGLRVALESTSVEQALSRLRAAGMASSAHFLIGDATTAVGLEFTSSTFACVPVSDAGCIVHANHMLLPHPGIDEPKWLDDSAPRVATMERNIRAAGQLSWEAFRTLFEDETGYPCSINRAAEGKGEFPTLFNICIDLEKRAQTDLSLWLLPSLKNALPRQPSRETISPPDAIRGRAIDPSTSRLQLGEMSTETIDNRGPELLAVNIFFCALAGVIVLLRCYSRAALVKAFGLDDWLMILATFLIVMQAFFIVYCVVSNLGVKHGTGQHQGTLDKQDVKAALKYWWFCYLFFSVTMITSKVSFAWFLLRITTTRMHSWIIYGASLCTILAGTIFFFVTLFQCTPVSFYWDKDLHGKCLDMNVIMALAYLYSVLSIFTDFTSAVVVRCGYLVRFKDPDFLCENASTNTSRSITHTDKWEGATTDIAIWSTVEMGLAISAASLATLRPLVKMAAWKLGLSTKQTTSARTPYGASNTRGLGPSSANGSTRFDNHVYVLSEFTQGTTKAGQYTDWKVGTHATAYADPQKESISDHENHVINGSTNSQENLNDWPSKEATEERKEYAAPKRDILRRMNRH
ncbi:integral membrane protein [Purpureocillium lavendulum]|uniref:Integral membrane protein n=1 Tax=Purpureocillium lavendulum TaxID=1247861 RepID=A0AB34FKC1_9HYPO|nr:integral membrane protein [Purpureocillium lavendulum]